jgi:hypothetical protein
VRRSLGDKSTCVDDEHEVRRELRLVFTPEVELGQVAGHPASMIKSAGLLLLIISLSGCGEFAELHGAIVCACERRTECAPAGGFYSSGAPPPSCDEYADAVIELTSESDSECIDALTTYHNIEANAECGDPLECEWLDVRAVCDAQVLLRVLSPVPRDCFP